MFFIINGSVILKIILVSSALSDSDTVNANQRDNSIYLGLPYVKGVSDHISKNLRKNNNNIRVISLPSPEDPGSKLSMAFTVSLSDNSDDTNIILKMTELFMVLSISHGLMPTTIRFSFKMTSYDLS